MLATRLKEIFKATAQEHRASVQDMPREFASVRAQSRDLALVRFQPRRTMRGFLAAFILFSLQIMVLTHKVSAAGLQSNAATVPSSQAATLYPAFSESLHPALEQVGNSVGQIQIDHWKLSKSWKAQLQSDADSITQDLSHQLPVLFQQAQAAPTALDAQLRVMQNVGALYDVLVRLTLAADLTEKKTDAAMLDSALQRLEAARKSATAQMVSAAALQHQQLVQLQMRIEASPANQSISGAHGKTIVVDNEVRHRTVHRTTHHKKPVASTTGAKSQPNGVQSTGNKPSPH